MKPHLYTELKGAGPALLLLHGFTGSTKTMWPLGETLTNRRTVIAVDLPGHGRTGLLPPPGQSFASTLDSLIDTLDGHGIEDADVLGYSMGGRIALGLVAKHPDRVRSLILLGSTAGISSDTERAARRRTDSSLAENIAQKGLEWFVDYWAELPIFSSQTRLDDSTLAEARKQRLDNDPDGLIASLLGSGTGSQPSFWEDLDLIRNQVLLLVGEEDIKYRRLAVRLASRLRKASTAVISGAGHAAHYENLPAVTKAITEFLDITDTERTR